MSSHQHSSSKHLQMSVSALDCKIFHDISSADAKFQQVFANGWWDQNCQRLFDKAEIPHRGISHYSKSDMKSQLKLYRGHKDYV